MYCTVAVNGVCTRGGGRGESRVSTGGAVETGIGRGAGSQETGCYSFYERRGRGSGEGRGRLIYVGRR